MTSRRFASLLLIPLLIASVGCSERPADTTAMANVELPELRSRADSVAMAVYEAYGGPAAWSSLRFLRFDFATGDDTSRSVHGRHFWDRMTGDYRVEMPSGTDTVYVALFNVNTQEGDVYMNGTELDSAREAELLESAYRRYINDTYWLLMPVKLLDPGVDRTYLADSSNAERDVLHLTFGNVGLTPGDQYWVYVDPQTHRVDQWAFRLQHHPEDHVPQLIEWAGHKELDTPHGEVVVSERKPRNGSVLYTDNVAVPDEAPEGVFSDPQPML